MDNDKREQVIRACLKIGITFGVTATLVVSMLFPKVSFYLLMAGAGAAWVAMIDFAVDEMRDYYQLRREQKLSKTLKERANG